jgi:hypothetical protein
LIRGQRYWADCAWAGGAAALLSGIPSTLYAWLAGGDVLEATRAAGAMLIPATSSVPALVAAAAVVHLAVSAFWTLILVAALPGRYTTSWSVLALAVIAFVSLRIVGRFFPGISALAFWPQFADHIAFGLTLGLVLQARWKRGRGPISGRIRPS